MENEERKLSGTEKQSTCSPEKIEKKKYLLKGGSD